MTQPKSGVLAVKAVCRVPNSQQRRKSVLRLLIRSGVKQADSVIIGREVVQRVLSGGEMLSFPEMPHADVRLLVSCNSNFP